MCPATEETIKVPITKEFLEQVLKGKVVRFETCRGSNPGDNFATFLISIKVHLADTSEPLYLVFKTFPTHPTRQRMLVKTNLLLKEMLVYEVWLKELVNFQKEIGNERILTPAAPPFVAGAAVDYESEEKKLEANPQILNFIIMADMRKTRCFKMANKLKSLDYLQVKVVMEELAKLHALSHAYKLNKGLSTLRNRYPCLFADPFLSNPRHSATHKGLVKGSLEVLSSVLKDFLEGRHEIDEVFRRLTEAPHKVSEAFQRFLHPHGMDEEEMEEMMREKPHYPPLKEQWVVVNHGDCWTNNILFKSDDNGNVSDAILVDFQGVRESCIMGDLAYFVYTSTDTAFRRQHLDEMLALYYSKFVEFCKILKVAPFSGFTLPNLRRKFHRSKIFGFYVVLMYMPIVLKKPGNALDMDTLDVGAEEEEDGMASIFKKMLNRDEEEESLLRCRFVDLLTELNDEGVL